MWFTAFKNISVQAVAILGCSLTLLCGCSGDNRKSNSNSSISSSSASSSSYIGQWYAPAYGYILSVSAENNSFKVEHYSVTQNYCLLQNVDFGLSLEDLEQDYGYSNVANEMLLQKKGDYLPGVEYEKVKQLPVICKENLLKVKSDSDYVFDAKKDVEIFLETFSELYINFELRDVNWDDVYAEAISATDSIHNEEELFEFLSDIITPLGDAHAVLLKVPLTRDLDESIAAARENEETLIFSKYTQLTLYDRLLNEYVEAIESDIELTDAQIEASENYINVSVDKIKNIILSYSDEDSEIKVRAAGEIAWFKTRDNIGYLFIGSMADYSEVSTTASDLVIAEAAIKEALSDLAGTDGLIIDVRFNTGGEDQVALNFVRHFMSQSQVVYSKSAGSGALSTPMKQVVLNPHHDGIYLKPTAVLVSGDTVSAAEIFTIAISSLPQITIIGEPTAGALSDVLVKRLTSDILFGISNETYLDTQGNNYEGVGFLPDIAVPFATPQERKDGYDAGIDKAIEWIKTAP